MFSAKLTRAAHRATCSTTTHSAGAASVISTSSTASQYRRPTSHARRHSSSKASSWPPSDNNTGKPAPAAKSNVEGEQTVATPRASSKQSKGRSRAGYKRIAEVKKPAEPVDQFAGLPSVPVISGMRVEGELTSVQDNLTLSKFFSLHRPVSITTTIPPPSTPEAFSSLFNVKRQTQDPWANGNSAERRPEDVVYTLHSLELPESGARSSEEDGLRWEVVHESHSNNGGKVTHLDGAARIPSIDELVARFTPFKAPPPPEPFPEENEQHAVVEKKSSARGRPKKKTYRATITVTESTDASGQKSYSASSTPIIRLPDTSESEEVAPASDRSVREPLRHRQPFLTRMRQRQRDNASRVVRARPSPATAIRKAPSPGRMERTQKMHLISVKRQRKLKMKKHKYKRLMKRTRTLRRRIERQ